MTAAQPDEKESTFCSDIGLCILTHRGQGPALVWPEGGHSFPENVLAQVPPGPENRMTFPPIHTPLDDSTGRPAGTAGDMAQQLSSILNVPVRFRYRELQSHERTPVINLASDLAVLPLRGPCECLLKAPTDKESRIIRLHVGEALYVPIDFTLTLHTGRSDCTLLEFLFRADEIPEAR